MKRYKFSKMRRSEALQQLAKESEVDTENSENEFKSLKKRKRSKKILSEKNVKNTCIKTRNQHKVIFIYQFSILYENIENLYFTGFEEENKK